MVLDLRTDGTELQIIGNELQFATEISRQFMMLWRERICNFRSEGKLCFAIEKAGDIVDDGLEVIGRFVELPDTLIDAGLIVECSNDQSTINGSATSSSILQHALRLIQVDDGFVELLLSNTFATSFVEFINLLE
jgi:hypothetical protein